MTARRPDNYLTPRAQFGQTLRQARDQAGIEGQDLGERTGIGADTISRFQLGKRFPSREQVEKIAQALGLNEAGTAHLLEQHSDAAAADKILRSNVPYGPKKAQEERNKLLTGASDISTFAVTEIPFYLQTLEYAQQELGDAPEAAAVAQLRVDAGTHVGARGKAFDILITEAALRFLPCDPVTMRGQISELQRLIDKPHVEFGIIPLGVPLAEPLKNGFSVYDNIAVIDTYAGELALTPKQATRYNEIMDRLADDAVRNDRARSILTAAANALPNS